MNTTSSPQPFASHLRDDAREAVRTAADTAKEAASQASQTAKDAYQAARLKAETTYQNVRAKAEGTYQNVRTKADETYRTVRTKADATAVRTGTYVRQHPVPSVLGAVALGVGLGFLLALSARRRPPTFREQFVDEPLDAAREALYSVLAPVAQRIRGGCESACGSAEKALDKMHSLNGSRVADSVSGQLHRVRGSLKFW